MGPESFASLFIISGLSLVCLQQPATPGPRPAETIQQTTPPATTNNYEVNVSGQTPVLQQPATPGPRPAETIQQTTPPATTNNYEVNVSRQTVQVPVQTPVCREVTNYCTRYVPQIPTGYHETYACGTRTVCQ